MLALHSSSVCDICMDAYASDDPDKIPHAIPCGHIFCKSCVAAFEPPNCPNCRSPFDSDRTVKLHVDEIAESDQAEQPQQPSSSWGSSNDEDWAEIQEQQLQIVFERETLQAIEAELTEKSAALERKVADYEAEVERLRTELGSRIRRDSEDQDYQLQIVFERETAQAMEMELLVKSKVLEDKVAELESEVERLRREGLLQKERERKVARKVQDCQRQIVFERETAQAVESTLVEKSKGLEEEVAEYEALVKQLQAELGRYKDNDRHARNVQPSEGKRTNSSFVSLLAAAPVGTSVLPASSSQSRTPQGSPSTTKSNGSKESDPISVTEEEKPNMFNAQTNSLAYFQQHSGSEPYYGMGSAQQFQFTPQQSRSWMPQLTQTGFPQQPQQTYFQQPQQIGFPQQHQQGMFGGNPFLQYTYPPHPGGQDLLPPHLQIPTGSALSNTVTPFAYPGSPPVASSSMLLAGTPTQATGLQLGTFMESPTSIGDRNGAYDFQTQYHQQQQQRSSPQSQINGVASSSTLDPGASSPAATDTWAFWPSLTSVGKSRANSDEQVPNLDATTTKSSPSPTASPPVKSPVKRMSSMKAFRPLSDFGASILASLPSISGSPQSSPVDQNNTSAHHHIASEE